MKTLNIENEFKLKDKMNYLQKIYSNAFDEGFEFYAQRMFNEDKDKEKERKRKIALGIGLGLGAAGLTAAGIWTHRTNKRYKKLKDDLDKTPDVINGEMKKLNDKMREIEEQKAKALAELQEKEGWKSVMEGQKKVEEELGKFQETKDEAMSSIADRHEDFHRRMEELQRRIDSYNS